MRLHLIRVEKISSFLLNKYAVMTFDYYMYLLCFKFNQLTYSLKCIIPAYCIHQSQDKNKFERKIVNVFNL